MNTAAYTSTVKQIATQLGFDYCGIAKADLLADDARRLEQWLKQNRHGTMHYMANHFDKRIDPRKLVDGAQSVITLLYNYYPQQVQDEGAAKISKYAYGHDYHTVIKNKLHTLLAMLQEKIGAVHGRGFVDSAPVLERAWAVQSGAGWVGKNGNLINKQRGSFFFIATLIVDVALEPDAPFAKDYCGTCTRCIDACPTQAILPNKEIDGSKCISYYTIELKDALIESDKQFDGWAFGCDTCQDVCPWNRFSQPHAEINFAAMPQVLHYTYKQWEEMGEEAFKKTMKQSPLARAKYCGLLRNIKFLRKYNEEKK